MKRFSRGLIKIPKLIYFLSIFSPSSSTLFCELIFPSSQNVSFFKFWRKKKKKRKERLLFDRIIIESNLSTSSNAFMFLFL